MHVFQQLGGINILMMYGAYILINSGYHNTLEETYITIILIQFSSVLGVIINVFIIDYFNRKSLLIFTMIPQVFSLLILTNNSFATLYSDSTSSFQKNSSVFCLIIFLFTYNIGLNSIPWIFNSEIHPIQLKEISISITSSFNWFTNFIISYSAP